MIRLKVREAPALRLSVQSERVTLRVAPAVVIERGGGGGKPYEGSYVITPNWGTQTLPTAGKTLEADIAVKPIPAEEVSNTGGGKTLIIGGI